MPTLSGIVEGEDLEKLFFVLLRQPSTPIPTTLLFIPQRKRMTL